MSFGQPGPLEHLEAIAIAAVAGAVIYAGFQWAYNREPDKKDDDDDDNED